MKFAKFLRTPPAAASEFCFGGCVSVSTYIIVNNVKKSMYDQLHDVAFIPR